MRKLWGWLFGKKGGRRPVSAGWKSREKSPVGINSRKEPTPCKTKGGISRSWSSEADIPFEWGMGDIILDTYEVNGVLGEGGMGKVYKVHHRAWNVDIAVKTPRLEIFSDTLSQQNFVQEAETWVNLGLHPNIVSCHYVRTLGGVPRVFVEYVESGSLEDWIELGKLYVGGKEIALERMLDIGIQFAWGLHYAHETGLVHRDVKPQNVMMMPDGLAKVTDFGLAKARVAAGEKARSENGQSILVSAGGLTPAYCSPEQATGQLLSRTTDIWSWGVSLLEMFTGGVTWLSGQAAPAQLENCMVSNPENDRIPVMPAVLAELLGQCFQENPRDRPTSMLVIIDRLQDIYWKEIGQTYPRLLAESIQLRADSLNNKALSLLDLGKLEDAMAAWESSQEVDPLHIHSIYNYGLWKWQTGRQPDDLEFIQQLEAAVMANRESWRSHYLLGMAHVARGDNAAAAKNLSEALQLSPDAYDARQVMNRLPENRTDRCLHKFSFQQPVQGIAFTPDGRYAVWTGGGSRGEDNSVLVWEVQSGDLVHMLEGHKYTVSQFCITPDSRKIVTGDLSTVRIWDLETGRCMNVLEDNRLWDLVTGEGLTKTLLLTPDGKYIVARAQAEDISPHIVLWDVTSGKRVQRYAGPKDRLLTIAITPDGRYILGGYYNGEIYIWEMITGRIIRTFATDIKRISVMAITHDGQSVLVGGEGGILGCWELETGHHRYTLSTPSRNTATGRVRQVLITPDDRRALSTSGSEITVWDIANGQFLYSLAVHKDFVSAIAITSDGKYGVSASVDHTVRVLDLERGYSLHTFIHNDEIRAMALSTDGKLILAAESQPDIVHRGTTYYEMYLWNMDGIDSKKAVWEPSRPTETYHLMEHAQKAHSDLDAARLAVLQEEYARAVEILRSIRDLPGFERDPEWLSLWRQVGRTSGQKKNLLFERCVLTIPHSQDAVFAMTCTPDGHYAMAGGFRGILQTWDLLEGKCLCLLKNDKKGGNVTGVALTPDDKYLLAIRGYDTLELWDWMNNRCVFAETIPSVHLLHLLITPDGRWAVTSALLNERLYLWELSLARNKEGIKLRRTLESGRPHSDDEGYGCIAISPDGQHIAIGSLTGQLAIWDLSTGKCEKFNADDSSGLTSIAYTPDGIYLVSGHEDGTLRYWRLSSRPKSIKTIEGHQQSVSSLAITPDGRHAASGSSDSTVRIWNLVTGECIRVLRGHIGAVNDIRVTAEGWKMVTGGADGTLRVWELDWEIGDVGVADWNDGARPYLQNFIRLHTPYSGTLSISREPTETEIIRALTRQGKPEWTDDEFRQLLFTLKCAGYGWLHPEGVRKELERIARAFS